MWYRTTALASSPLGAELEESNTARVAPAARSASSSRSVPRAAEQEDGLDILGGADQGLRVVEIAEHAFDALGPGRSLRLTALAKPAAPDVRRERRARRCRSLGDEDH